MNPIPLSYPCLRGNEKKYVLDCLESEWISTSGKTVSDFERAIASYTSSAGAVACVNGTAALHICLLLAGVLPGEEVVVPTLTFIAPINTVKYAFAEPIFMDCDEYLNMDMEKLERFLRDECDPFDCGVVNRRTGRTIRAVIPVHIFGSICDMDRLMEIAGRYRLTVIEDATESLGSTVVSGAFAGRHAGTIGDFGAYSFNGNKIITCGGGGMLTARNPDMLKRAKYLTTQAKNDELHYVHEEIGYNYRMPAIQAAMGIAQLEQLPNFVAVKQKRYDAYKSAISEIPGLSLLDIPPWCNSNCWFYSLMIDAETYGVGRDELMMRFEEKKIQTRPIWKLNHTQKPYLGNQAYQIEKAPFYFDRILNIPCSVGLTDDEFDRVLNVLLDPNRE
jgi:perosamine synthetase